MKTYPHLMKRYGSGMKPSNCCAPTRARRAGDGDGTDAGERSQAPASDREGQRLQHSLAELEVTVEHYLARLGRHRHAASGQPGEDS